VYEVCERQENNVADVAGYMMIKTLHIENFRCFKLVDIPKLGRVNIIVGKNAGGKTALLEGVKLALDAFPNVLPWFNQIRGIPTFLLPNPTAEQFRALFVDFFHGFKSDEQIVTWFTDSSGKTASLHLKFDPARAVTSQPSLGFQPAPAPPPMTVVPLAFERIDLNGQKSAPCATVNAQGQFFLEPANAMGIVSGLIGHAYFGGAGENATWLSQLSVDKRDVEVVDAIRRHFPFIKGVTSETISQGTSNVYADLPDLPKKLPLSLVSSGISRLFTFILAIVQFGDGVVLIDEIENGIFHTQYEKVWKTLIDLAKLHNTQLFVSTHSSECLTALLPSLQENEEEFTLLHTKRETSAVDVELHSGKALSSLIRQGFDPRGE
jgi:predicted ATPase